MDFSLGTSTSILLFISFVALLWLLYSKYNETQNSRQSAERNLKYVQIGNFFVESLKGEDPGVNTDRIIRREGKVFGFTMFFKYTVMLAEPELIQQVLSKEFTNFTNRRVFKVYDLIFKYALSVVTDERWKRLRSVITPTFSAGKLRRMKPRIDDSIGTLVKNLENSRLKNENIVDIKPLAGAFTMDTICQVAFGMKVDSLADESNHMIIMAKRLFQQDLSIKNIAKVAVAFLLPRVAHALNIRINGDVSDYFTAFSGKIIQEKREEFRKNENRKADSFIELILEAEVEAEKENGKLGKAITNEEMIANCVIFFLAGYETTSSAITMATYLIATHPKIQERLSGEIKSTFRKLAKENPTVIDPIQLVTFESLSRFEYLNAIVSETLRLHAPAPFIERSAAQDIHLETEDGKVKINLQAGDVVHIPVYSTHHNPEQFPEPAVFNPERFLGAPTHHKYAYIPFGSGPRNCVARSLALLEVKLAVLHIFHNFKVTPCETTNIPMKFFNQGSFVTPKDCFLKVEKS